LSAQHLHYRDVVAVFLVRHAHAVGRGSWKEADERRPLSKRGQRQARGLMKTLANEPIRRILSSPAVRCVDSVRPLAESLDLPVRKEPALREEASTGGALELVRRVAVKSGDSVLCAHGDLVPKILWALSAEGARLGGNHRWEKGSTWVLEFEGDRCVGGRYLPPVEA
jgi:8-oxo-(d)GTP phosphatase